MLDIIVVVSHHSGCAEEHVAFFAVVLLITFVLVQVPLEVLGPVAIEAAEGAIEHHIPVV